MALTLDQLRYTLRAFEPDYAGMAKHGPQLLPHLNILVREGNPTIASRSAYLAGILNDDRSEGIIRAAAASSSPKVRAAAADAARKFQRPAASGLLISLLHDQDAGVRKVALRAAATSSNAALVSKIASLSQTDSKPWIRKLAAQVVQGRRVSGQLAETIFSNEQAVDPGEVSYEETELFENSGGGTARPRRSPGTDCGKAGSPAALKSSPGGRCIGPTPPTCPPTPGIASHRGVDGVPFEYVGASKRAKDPATGLLVFKTRIPNHSQRFVPSTQAAVRQFLANMTRFGMPVEAILTMGSYCCRCMTGTNTLSNHSMGNAIDVGGIRLRSGREVIVYNWANPGERALLRRIGACLRLSFTTVIDWWDPKHKDHFHCDTNLAQRPLRWRNTNSSAQEALTVVLGRRVPVTGNFDAATKKALLDFSGQGPEALRDPRTVNRILDDLYTRIAAG